jgi:hypothetical protein
LQLLLLDVAAKHALQQQQLLLLLSLLCQLLLRKGLQELGLLQQCCQRSSCTSCLLLLLALDQLQVRLHGGHATQQRIDVAAASCLGVEACKGCQLRVSCCTTRASCRHTANGAQERQVGIQASAGCCSTSTCKASEAVAEQCPSPEPC